MKKLRYLLLSFLYIAYAISVVTANDWVGAFLSSLLTLIVSYYILKNLFIRETNFELRTVGLFLTIGLLFWLFRDVISAVCLFFLQRNPEEYRIVMDCYFLTNLCFLVAFFIVTYRELKDGNKVQTFLDAIIIFICILELIWVFVFNQEAKNMKILETNMVSMISMSMDILIYICINLWFFSIKKKKVPFFLRIFVTGGILFCYTDFMYYYQFFYYSDKPNRLTDAFYLLSFTLIGIAGIIKKKGKEEGGIVEKVENMVARYWKESLFAVTPLLLLLFKEIQARYLFFLILCIMIYYISSFYNQNSILKDELLIKEKKYVEELENKVRERTWKIEALLNTDVITGLYSRRYFEVYLTKLCENLGKHEKIVLLYIEQNKCKNSMITYKKYSLESVLRQVGNRMDVVAKDENGLLSVYGDNLFTLVVKIPLSDEKGEEIANRIIKTCSDIYYLEGHDVLVTMNIGVSCYPTDSKTCDELLKNAEAAMILSRKIGYNKVLNYTRELGEQLYGYNEMDMQLKKLKFEQALLLYFQPQVSCIDGAFIGFEALIRWKKEDGSFISPVDFIPIAEENGLILSLGEWIFEQAVKQLEKWEQTSTVKVRMAINVSVKQLEDKEFLSKVESIVNRYHVLPEDIEIEITENKQLEENLDMVETLRKINKMGISIAIDDFGTGYSSLYYLKHLPINRIKIAKELIDNISKDVYDYTIVRMAIEIARTKGIKVIAEGVERKEQWNCLKELNCDEIQGYYFGKPMGMETENEYLKKVQL